MKKEYMKEEKKEMKHIDALEKMHEKYKGAKKKAKKKK
jgi:hypothetical protein